jgi:hypothetical protein
MAKKALEGRIAEIEATLAPKEARRSELLTRLQDSAVWSDAAKATALQAEHDTLAATIEKLTQEWEAKAAELEELVTPAALEG